MPHLKKRFPLLVNKRELATILAALRFHQDENLQGKADIPDQIIKEIATDAGFFRPLNFQEVDELCERINLGKEPVGWQSCQHQWKYMDGPETGVGKELWYCCLLCGATKYCCTEQDGSSKEEIYPPEDNDRILASPGLTIEPPPEDKGEESLWRVVYIIDVNAVDAHAAAVEVHRIMQNPDSLAPILEIIDGRGKVTRVDLAEDDNHSKEDSTHG